MKTALLIALALVVAGVTYRDVARANAVRVLVQVTDGQWKLLP